MAGFSASSVDLLVVDEAQRISNPRAKQSVAVAGVGMAASARILVTATPLANRMAELGALLQHAQPGLLGDVTGFDACIVQPFETGRARGASAEAKAALSLAADGLRLLSEPLTLRRTRAQLQKGSGCSIFVNVTLPRSALLSSVRGYLLYMSKYQSNVSLLTLLI